MMVQIFNFFWNIPILEITLLYINIWSICWWKLDREKRKYPCIRDKRRLCSKKS